MDDEDIYGDLGVDTQVSEIPKLKEQKYIDHIKTLQNDINKLMNSLLGMKENERKLLQNISSLLLTAKAEIERKNKTINELRTELDALKCNKGFNSAKRRLHEHDDNRPSKRPMLENENVPSTSSSTNNPEMVNKKLLELAQYTNDTEVKREPSPDRLLYRYRHRHHSSQRRSRSPSDQRHHKKPHRRSHSKSYEKRNFNSRRHDHDRHRHRRSRSRSRESRHGRYDRRNDRGRHQSRGRHCRSSSGDRNKKKERDVVKKNRDASEVKQHLKVEQEREFHFSTESIDINDQIKAEISVNNEITSVASNNDVKLQENTKLENCDGLKLDATSTESEINNEVSFLNNIQEYNIPIYHSNVEVKPIDSEEILNREINLNVVEEINRFMADLNAVGGSVDAESLATEHHNTNKDLPSGPSKVEEDSLQEKDHSSEVYKETAINSPTSLNVTLPNGMKEDPHPQEMETGRSDLTSGNKNPENIPNDATIHEVEEVESNFETNLRKEHHENHLIEGNPSVNTFGPLKVDVNSSLIIINDEEDLNDVTVDIKQNILEKCQDMDLEEPFKNVDVLIVSTKKHLPLQKTTGNIEVADPQTIENDYLQLKIEDNNENINKSLDGQVDLDDKATPFLKLRNLEEVISPRNIPALNQSITGSLGGETSQLRSHEELNCAYNCHGNVLLTSAEKNVDNTKSANSQLDLHSEDVSGSFPISESSVPTIMEKDVVSANFNHPKPPAFRKVSQDMIRRFFRVFESPENTWENKTRNTMPKQIKPDEVEVYLQKMYDSPNKTQSPVKPQEKIPFISTNLFPNIGKIPTLEEIKKNYDVESLRQLEDILGKSPSLSEVNILKTIQTYAKKNSHNLQNVNQSNETKNFLVSDDGHGSKDTDGHRRDEGVERPQLKFEDENRKETVLLTDKQVNATRAIETTSHQTTTVLMHVNSQDSVEKRVEACRITDTIQQSQHISYSAVESESVKEDKMEKKSDIQRKIEDSTSESERFQLNINTSETTREESVSKNNNVNYFQDVDDCTNTNKESTKAYDSPTTIERLINHKDLSKSSAEDSNEMGLETVKKEKNTNSNAANESSLNVVEGNDVEMETQNESSSSNIHQSIIHELLRKPSPKVVLERNSISKYKKKLIVTSKQVNTVVNARKTKASESTSAGSKNNGIKGPHVEEAKPADQNGSTSATTARLCHTRSKVKKVVKNLGETFRKEIIGYDSSSPVACAKRAPSTSNKDGSRKRKAASDSPDTQKLKQEVLSNKFIDLFGTDSVDWSPGKIEVRKILNLEVEEVKREGGEELSRTICRQPVETQEKLMPNGMSTPSGSVGSLPPLDVSTIKKESPPSGRSSALSGSTYRKRNFVVTLVD